MKQIKNYHAEKMQTKKNPHAKTFKRKQNIYFWWWITLVLLQAKFRNKSKENKMQSVNEQSANEQQKERFSR